MRRLLLCLALVFSVAGGALAETPQTIAKELSALKALEITKARTGGVLDGDVYAIDISNLAVSENTRSYWEGMRLVATRFGVNNKTGENSYVLVLAPLTGRTDMPAEAQAVYRLESTGKIDERSGKPIYKVGNLVGMYMSDTSTVDQPNESKQSPKSDDRCTIDKPCDEMKRQAPCPHHDKGKCEHMEKHQEEPQKKDRGVAI